MVFIWYYHKNIIGMTIESVRKLNFSEQVFLNFGFLVNKTGKN